LAKLTAIRLAAWLRIATVLNLLCLRRRIQMSIKSKIAAIAAASIGMVLTQSSSPRAETEDNSAAEKVTKIAAPIDVDEEVLYSAVPDEALEKAAASPLTLNCAPTNAMSCSGGCQVKKPSSGGLKYEDRKVPLGPTVAPKPTQGIKNK
jgi:hypothetical protein